MCTCGTGGTCGRLAYRHVCIDMCVSTCVCLRVCRHVHVGSPPRGRPSRTRRTTATMTAPATTTRHHMQLGGAPAMGAPATTTNPILRRVIPRAKNCGKTRLFAIKSDKRPIACPASAPLNTRAFSSTIQQCMRGQLCPGPS